MTEVTRERVEAAYAALGSGDRARILEYYSVDLRWLVPGSHPLAGGADPASLPTYEGMDYPVFHFMRWRDGRISEGRDGLFGDSATAFSQFWAPFAPDGTRRDR